LIWPNRSLTTGLDALVGTSGNDTFIGSFDGLATSTSNLGDAVNGGGGSDTVRIFSNNGPTPLPSLVSVETLELVDTVHEDRNVAGIALLTRLVLEGGSTTPLGADITLTIAAGQTVSLRSVLDGTPTLDGVNSGTLNIASAAAVTAVALEIDGVGAQAGADALNDLDLAITGAGVASLSIASTGTNNISLGLPPTVTTLTMTGAGTTVVQGPPGTGITTFNAQTATGALTVDLSASTGANQTVTGGSGVDTLTVDLQRNITLNAGAGNDVVTLANPTAANLSSLSGAADAINGGDGTDTLQLTAVGAVALAGDTAADRAVITGFERLRVSDNLDASTFSIGAFGFNYLQVGVATTANAATVTGFSSGATVEYRDNADSTVAVNVGMTGATAANTPNDTLTIVLNANLVNQAAAADAIDFFAGVDGINKLNVSTADRDNADGATARDDGYILTLSQAAAVDTITVTGDRELSFTSGPATNALTVFNAAALSGDLIVDVSGFTGNQGISITGGGGTNVITGTTLGDILIGGARADTFTPGPGADVMTGGAGADVVVLAAADFTAATAAALGAAADSLTDFGAGSDIIRYGGPLTIVQNGTAQAGVAAINAEGIATFDPADTTLAQRITAVEAGINAGGGAAAGQMAIFALGSDSYVFISNGTDGINANDALIRLVGVTGLTDSTITGNNLTIV